MPHRSSVAQPWRMQASRYRLMGTVCGKCATISFPPVRACGVCGSTEMKEHVLGGAGEVVSYTIIHTAPDGFEGATPYAVGLIRLSEGPVITAQISGELSEIKIGSAVRPVFRRISEHGDAGLISYGFKFAVV